MALTMEQIEETVLALPEEGRRHIYASLGESLDGGSGKLHPDWAAELRFRSEEYRAGRMEAIPLEEFLLELEKDMPV